MKQTFIAHIFESKDSSSVEKLIEREPSPYQLLSEVPPPPPITNFAEEAGVAGAYFTPPLEHPNQIDMEAEREENAANNHTAIYFYLCGIAATYI